LIKKVKGLTFVAFFTTSFLFFSCATTSKGLKEIPVKEEEEVVVVSEPISIPLPVNTDRSYFASIDKAVLTLVQDGSPFSLGQAISQLHKSDVTQYKNNEAVLLNIISQLLTIVWPSEHIKMEVPVVKESNPYTEAIESAKKGIYDTSTGNNDFFTLLLPSLVLLTTDSKTDFYAQSEAALTKALNIQKTSLLANYLMGLLYLRQEKADKAVEYFNIALANDSSVFEIQKNLAEAYFIQKNYEKTLDLCEALLVKQNQNVELLQLCAQSSYALNNLERSEDYVLRVLQLDPANIDYVLFRAEILMNKADYVRASSLLDVYGRSDPTGRKYLLLRAQMQKNWNKNTTTASETLSTALRLYPEDEEVLLMAAEFSSSTEIVLNDKSALDYASKVLDKNPTELRALIVCISEMIKKGDWLSAYSVCQPLVEREDVTSDILYNYINICLHLNKSSEAWSLISGLYQANPEDEVTQQMYIQVLIATKRNREALTLINALIPSANSKMKSFLYYQKSLLDTDEETVLSDLRSSLTANPRNADVLYRLYQIYYGRSDWKRAQYYLKQVVALEPKNQDILNKNQELDALLGK